MSGAEASTVAPASEEELAEAVAEAARSGQPLSVEGNGTKRAMLRPVQAARTRLVPVAGSLRAGETVMAGVARLFAEAGCPGGVVFLDGVTCDPMRYVLPALSRDASHAAWYSGT